MTPETTVECRAQHLPEVAWLGFSVGTPGGRACARWQSMTTTGIPRLGRKGLVPSLDESESTAGGGAHGANAGVRGADRHIDDTDLVFNLTDEDVCLAGVFGHPAEGWGRGAHWIRAIKLDAWAAAPPMAMAALPLRTA